ncbi:TPA: hypothetical protein M5M69_004847 [Citrobacter freundii]|uniref:hypothetical protein n=1 Tax=Citrobacter freundii TaxID=546 RepID=UPI001B83F875|nr:hypothetical protein [Citrobacter freundii]HBC2002100.1 hypothetical protein [Citrobacter freundii]HBM8408822.1 hypothetical protein [Citrobacter freundii]HBM9445713.1 hypothetical protein [Citrobacter freundii]HCC4675157.1 hypothetical protein [Citrobacter freundii]
MSLDSILISKAIMQLKQETDPIKDYLFPILMSFFSALLGGVAAYYFNLRQEQRKNEKDNFNAASKILTNVLLALNNLVAIKSNYCGMEIKDPLLRAISIPTLIMNDIRLEVDLSSLTFIKNVPTANKGVFAILSDWLRYRVLRLKRNSLSSEEMSKSWRNLNRLGACVNNYNYVLELLRIRSALDSEIRTLLVAKENEVTNGQFTHDVVFSFEMIFNTIGRERLVKYIDLTETIISIIDGVLKEFDSFIFEFPIVAESNIELSKVGRGVRMVRIDKTRPLYVKCIAPITPPDFEQVAQLTGMPVEQAKSKYTYSDWY